VFLSATLAEKKQPKQVRKRPEIRKNFNFEVAMAFLGQFVEIIHKFSSVGPGPWTGL